LLSVVGRSCRTAREGRRINILEALSIGYRRYKFNWAIWSSEIDRARVMGPTCILILVASRLVESNACTQFAASLDCHHLTTKYLDQGISQGISPASSVCFAYHGSDPFDCVSVILRHRLHDFSLPTFSSHPPVPPSPTPSASLHVTEVACHSTSDHSITSTPAILLNIISRIPIYRHPV
jgi:hypothetical protein